MDTPQFTVQDFDEALSYFLDMHPSLRYDRKQVGRAVTCKIYDGIGELGFIRMGPGRGQSREVHLSAYSKAAHASLGGPWWAFGSNVDPKRAFDDRDRKFRTICWSFYAYFKAIHLSEKVKGRGTGFKLLDLDETPDRAGAPATALGAGVAFQGHTGHPGLDRDELIYRLAKAQEAEEIRHNNPDMQWKEIAQMIQWNKGPGENGLALLRDARHRLKRLSPDDPLLGDVARFRAKKTKKT